jgi:hypothetical protein
MIRMAWYLTGNMTFKVPFGHSQYQSFAPVVRLTILLHSLLCLSVCLSCNQPTNQGKLAKQNVEYLSNHWSDLLQI